MSPALSARGAGYRWKGRDLVCPASLDLETGKSTVIIGANGAGKSTLLRVLSGELRPTAGAVFCGQETIDAIPPWRLACRRAVMTQAVDVAFPFTALEVVRLGLESTGPTMPRQRQMEVVERTLDAAEALDFADRRYNVLSGGEKRRIHFARALAQLEAGRSVSPIQALLLDEPVANLDLRHQLKLLDEARRLASAGTAVLAVLHDLNLAIRYADILVVMRNGSIVAQGPVGEISHEALLTRAFDVDLRVGLEVVAHDPLILPRSWVSSTMPA